MSKFKVTVESHNGREPVRVTYTADSFGEAAVLFPHLRGWHEDVSNTEKDEALRLLATRVSTYTGSFA